MTRVGIDLGTTNTVVARGGAPLELYDGGVRSRWLPSVVAFPPSGARLVGSEARRRRPIDPANTLFSSKRIMGASWLSGPVQEFRKSYPFDLVESARGPAFRTRAGAFTAEDIAVQLLEHVHAGLGEVSSATLTVPSGFAATAKDATRRAAERAGFGAVSVIDEPVAAVLAYWSAARVEPRRAVVYDFGGGTFDLAVLDCSGTLPVVVARGGDLHLGGDDLDRALALLVAESVVEQQGWDLRADGPTFDRLIAECERAKRELAARGSATLHLSEVDPAAPESLQPVRLGAEHLESLSAGVVQRTFLVCDEVLRDAGLKAAQIDTVCLAGGSTLLPAVRQGIASYFGRAPAAGPDAMLVVAIGASLVRSAEG